MKEIKFRGKRKDNNGWVFGDLIHLKNGKVYIGKNITTEGFYWETFEVDTETVGQYTGLKDKNGKEIYKGDIVENKNGTKYLIKFDDSMGQFVKKKLNKVFDFGGNSIGVETNLRGIKRDKVIGNKYKDGDLIERS